MENIYHVDDPSIFENDSLLSEKMNDFMEAAQLVLDKYKDMTHIMVWPFELAPRALKDLADYDGDSRFKSTWIVFIPSSLDSRKFYVSQEIRELRKENPGHRYFTDYRNSIGWLRGITEGDNSPQAYEFPEGHLFIGDDWKD